jgi:excisionase family DNA binding protein
LKADLEPQDIEAIAQRVSELIRAILFNVKRPNDKEVIFDTKGLAEYLHINSSWINKQVSFKAIPYFKMGKYNRFKKTEIDRWTESKSIKPIPGFSCQKIKH